MELTLCGFDPGTAPFPSQEEAMPVNTCVYLSAAARSGDPDPQHERGGHGHWHHW